MNPKQICSFDLTTDENRKVFEYVKTKATHDDLVEVLIDAVKPLGDVQISCPGAVVASTKGIIFVFAMGTGAMVFRLDSNMREIALRTGGTSFPDCGPTWACLIPFRPNWPKADFEFWARKAYSIVREAA